MRDAVDVYGSGGFTSYDMDRLERQFGDWTPSVALQMARAFQSYA